MIKEIVSRQCPICGSAMRNRVCGWTFYCDSCDYWGAFLEQNINSQDDYIFSDERNDSGVISFLDSIRIKNFNTILDEVVLQQAKKSLRILDVGCASGLFIKIAGERGHIVTGIEPNSIMAKIASDKGFDVINGYFPAAILPASKFDVIIFNDVFEHIPDVNEILHHCNIFLNDEGVLVINLPNARGVLFRLAKMLAMMGVMGPWRRLWQVMFYTPHVHYFSSSSLDKLLKKYNLRNCSGAVAIDALSLTGLWDRLAIDRSNNVATRLILFVGIVLFYPITRVLEKDAFYSIYKK